MKKEKGQKNRKEVEEKLKARQLSVREKKRIKTDEEDGERDEMKTAYATRNSANISSPFAKQETRVTDKVIQIYLNSGKTSIKLLSSSHFG